MAVAYVSCSIHMCTYVYIFFVLDLSDYDFVLFIFFIIGKIFLLMLVLYVYNRVYTIYGKYTKKLKKWLGNKSDFIQFSNNTVTTCSWSYFSLFNTDTFIDS